MYINIKQMVVQSRMNQQLDITKKRTNENMNIISINEEEHIEITEKVLRPMYHILLSGYSENFRREKDVSEKLPKGSLLDFVSEYVRDLIDGGSVVGDRKLTMRYVLL